MLGFLLARWIVEVAESVDGPRFDLVEAAAHDGRLAGDVLEALQRFHPETLNRVRYRILEPSEPRRRAQRERLAPWGERVAWHGGWEEVEDRIRGAVFSNELLDAMPVRRFAWSASGGRWRELGVEVRDGCLAACFLETEADSLLPDWRRLEPYLPDGYVVERCPAAEGWWRQAASALEAGALLALDYGVESSDRFRPERTHGTARAYCRHRACDDLLARPGEQDLTAHVDFPRLIEIGEEAGLRTLDLLPQGRWLGRWATRVVGEGGEGARWLTERARGLQTLVHPQHLGQAMRALVQQRV
ncbi:MAG: SAM-dependent methyltransferase [Verrucomicrobiales bacterium]|nr:SAM-dependent methyltransferase [Verrucomicrobiales bacterium]